MINAIPSEERRRDAWQLLGLFTKATGELPQVWADKYIGFGRYHYRYATGHQGEIYKTGFSVTKTKITLHVYLDEETMAEALGGLGKFKAGKSCLYINKLADVDQQALLKLIEKGYAFISKTYD